VLVVGDENYVEAGEGKDAGAPACGCSCAACSLVPKTLPYPENPGLEALRRRMKSAEDGSASLGQSGVRLELQDLKSFLTKIKEDVDAGIKRVEEVILALDGLKVGLGDGQSLEDAGSTVLKPKRKKKRRKNRRNKKNNKENPSGPKPGTSLISVAAGAKPE
jgi:hypothetical protein